ncbi:small subunit of carbamoyl phosphate synthase [Ceraceosorus guamensis]|uniref:Carbamoyl phosphate synthase arginine-specific small chain n=1 Tax=Ceraceosorus guamensis TaxID=1522189 RepID=A0A316VXZ2_9BASI|nr:small subunit of carbamoyl phosphate synthase [Ceraceosorus guamensis]PWN42527.1 small subunit of carbamoyl phosphate synthase [Ceraceosorus guamensis]
MFAAVRAPSSSAARSLSLCALRSLSVVRVGKMSPSHTLPRSPSVSSSRGLATAVPALDIAITSSPAPESQPATLHLKSGQAISGKSFGSPRTQFGEVVFTTAITSYTESLTDPSYQGQILVFTQPLMGNYGVPDNFSGYSPNGHAEDVDVGAFLESRGIQAAGVVVSDLCERFSHFEARESLASWCARHDVPGISGVDTRALTTLLRNQGSTLGGIVVGEKHDVKPEADQFFDPMELNLIQSVSTKHAYTIHPRLGESGARAHIALLDFGSKANIVRCLVREGVSVTVLPWNYDFNAVRDRFDGLFLSNGPGSPNSIPEAIETTRKVITEWNRPVFGICMGNQIIGLAAGATCYRMSFGNRGHNQPVISLSTVGNCIKAGRVYVTSQNHGYCLSWDHDAPNGGWPAGWIPWFVNANDGSIEGLRASPESGKLVWAAQFHPESAGGPQDSHGMFTDYVDEVVKLRNAEGRSVGKGLEEEQLVPAPRSATGTPIGHVVSPSTANVVSPK